MLGYWSTLVGPKSRSSECMGRFRWKLFTGIYRICRIIATKCLEESIINRDLQDGAAAADFQSAKMTNHEAFKTSLCDLPGVCHCLIIYQESGQ